MDKIILLNLHRFLGVILCLWGVIYAPSALAQASSATGTITATITLTDACSVNNTNVVANSSVNAWGTLSFGSNPTTFTTASASSTGSGSPISIQCSTGVTPAMVMIAGSNDAHKGSNTHAMAFSTFYIPYDVYKDSAHSQIINNTDTIWTGPSDGSSQTVTIYGVAHGAAGLSVGTYTDTLTIQLNY